MAAFTAITSTDIATSPESITNALLAPTAGITIDYTSLSIVSGATSIGYYDGSLTGLGIGSGLLLTSGLMPGITNTSTAYGISNNMVGDADLNAVVNSVFQTVSYDATTLSFNFTITDPSITSISFNLVFGSDEYPEWVNQFVDIGVVLVNGVNVAYFNGNPQAPLSVIGSNLSNGYFINNADSHLPIEYDGVSAPLTIYAPVHQGLNTLKIGVADTGDHILDTGLIISNMLGSDVPVYGVTLDIDGTELDDSLTGGDIGENIHGHGGHDTCVGGGGDDVMYGDDGDDSLSGDSGNDYLDGGFGSDIAKYAGLAANYEVVAYTDGTVKVLDILTAGPAGDGQDKLTGIEFIQFADLTIDVTTLPQIPPPVPGGAIAPPVVNGPAELTVTEDGAVGGLGMTALLAGATPAGLGDILSITGLPAVLPAGVTFSTVPGGFLAPPISTLSIDPKNAAYQSLAAGETTTVSVAYNVTNAMGSTPNTAVFTVVGVNDSPIVAGTNLLAAVEGDAVLTLDLLANVTDVDNGAVLTIVEIPLPPVVITPPPIDNGNGNHGGDQPPPPPPPTGSELVSGAYTLSTLPAGITYDALNHLFTIDPSDANFQRLSEGQVSNLTIHFGVSDGTVVVATSALISITGTNDLPVVTGSLAYAVNEGSVLAINPLANISDADVFDSMTITTLGVAPAGVSLTSFNAGHAAYQNLAAGETTTVTWNYSVSDGHVSVENSATFTITGVNDAPLIVVQAAATMAEDAAPVTVSAIAGATDIDVGAVLSVVNVPAILPAGISYDALTEIFTIDPSNAVFQQLAEGESQVYTVAYGISDGIDTTPTSVRFTVIGVNDAPIVIGPNTGSPNEDGNVVTVNATGNVTDVDDRQGLQVTGVPEILPAGVTYDAVNLEFNLDPTDPAFQYLSQGETATIAIDYNVFDGYVELPTSVIFTITGKNDAPSAIGVVEIGAVSENAVPLSLNLLTNVVDVDHLDNLTVRTNQGEEPVFSVSGAVWNAPISYSLANNQISLNPAQFNSLRGGETLDITINYRITDGSADGDAFGSTHLSVVGENDAPSALAISSSNITENAAVGAVVGQISATDADRGETLSYQLLNDANGLFALSNGNRLVVAPGAVLDYEVATSHSIEVQVTDAVGATFVRTFNIAINNVGGVDIIASNKADVISPTAPIDLRSTNEEDTIDGKGDNDTINAGGGNDSVLGDAGNDTITGGAGNDTMNGGAGTDTAVFTGTWSNYDVSITGGITTVIDRRAAPNDGTDSLQSIESLRFVNGTFSIANSLNTGPLANADIGGGLIESDGVNPGVAIASGNVVSNDTDANLSTVGLGETLSVSGIRAGAPADGGAMEAVAGATLIAGTFGTLTIEANGGYSYSLDNARPATESLATGATVNEVFTYLLRDAHGATSVAQLSFNIQGSDEAPNSAPTGAVVIVGAASVGATLTADNTLADVDGLGAISYQWRADGVDIDGATTGSYVLTAAEAGKTITVLASYIDLRGSPEAVVSAPTSAVFNPTHTGTANADTLTGTAADEQFFGLEGNDTINAGSGDDLLDGGIGIDRMLGGLGNDTYVVDSAGDGVIEGVNAGIDTIQSSIGKSLATLVNIENLTLTGASNLNATGNALNNILTGNDGNNVLNGGLGADTMQGGLGDDTYGVDNIGDVVIEAVGAGVDKVNALISYTLGDNVEKLALTGIDNLNGTGNSLNNAMTGNAGSNILDGAAGADTMNGGLGDDTYHVDNVGDYVGEGINAGIDTILSSISKSLAPLGNVENLVLTGTGNLNATGNALNNILTGNDGINVLNGGLGADTMAGGLGNDAYIVDSVGDVVIENAGEGTDKINAAISYTLLDNFENLALTGSADLNGTGNAINNGLTGNSGNNSLDGGLGNDVLSGGAGADILIGGFGNDRLTGGADADQFVFNTTPGVGNVDTITDFLSGTDSIVLDGAVFTGFGGALTVDMFVSGAGLATAADANDHLIYNTGNGGLYYDADGLGGTAAVKLANLSGAPALGFADFSLV